MNIKSIRTQAYMTQEKFAKAIGVHINSVRAWEQGRNKPSLTQMGKIAEFCEKHNIDKHS
jgi:DNA-binding transcriptional regulator YiaG